MYSAYCTYATCIEHVSRSEFGDIDMTQLVKICGLRTEEAATQAIDHGADLLGVIMVPNRKRTAEKAVVAEISKRAKDKRRELNRKLTTAQQLIDHLSTQTFNTHTEYFDAFQRLVVENGPFLVGVFRNQNVEEVFRAAEECSLDFIQLHGSEKEEDYLTRNQARYGIIKRYVLPTHVEHMGEFFPSLVENPRGFAFPLLDSELGGEGQTIDWTLIHELDGRFILAGGLTPDNLSETVPYLDKVFGYDVSGGVESADGNKDLNKIAQFITNGKKNLHKLEQMHDGTYQ